MITKINGITFNKNPYIQNTNAQKPITPNINFNGIKKDTFQKATKALSLNEAIDELYKKMSNPNIKNAEVYFSKDKLLFVNLDNMKLQMTKTQIDGKDKILTFFSHKTKCNTGKVNSVIKMTNDNLDNAIKQLKSRKFIEKLEKMTEKLNTRPDFMTIPD